MLAYHLLGTCLVFFLHSGGKKASENKHEIVQLHHIKNIGGVYECTKSSIGHPKKIAARDFAISGIRALERDRSDRSHS